MRNLTAIMLVCFCCSAGSFAKTAPQRQIIRLDKKRIAIFATEDQALDHALLRVRRHHGYTTNALGPGKKLMESYSDYGSNGSVLANLYDYGDGTLAVGRTGALDPSTSDRATFFSFFDGARWSPMTKVEGARRSGSSLAALHEGRSVIVSQSGNEANVDSVKGAGVWRSSLTNGATSAAALWPHFIVDGRDNIIICSTTNAAVSGVFFIKQVNISRDGGQSWQHALLWPDTSTYKPVFSADDQALAVFGDNVAIAVCETGGDTHLWTSANNGASWAYQNITNYPQTLPAGAEGLRGAGTIAALYDHAGDLHLFWENYLARPEAAGTGLELYESTDDPILHWSASAGLSPVVRFSDIPGAASDSLVFAAGGSFDQINADGALLKQPQAGLDAAGNLYLLFAAFRPNDIDIEGAHFTDLYATGSRDGGKTWAAPVNVTDTPQSEDLWASLAKNVKDSLRFVYQSDGNTGNGLIGGGAAPTTFLYHAYVKSNIPLSPTAVAGPAAEIPATWALQQNYPNPFNPSTAISFSLPASMLVRLEVYNMVGQKMATLVQGRLAAGSHAATWDAWDAPAGIYFYRLTGEGFSFSRKMVLLKMYK